MRRRLLTACTVVAAVATVGSLYFSEIAGYPPCELCWYQRVFMYPLVLVLGVAAVEDRAEIWTTALALSGLGLVTAAYHVGIQTTGSSGVTCSVGAGCGAVYWQGVGVLTIPRLSLLAFALVTAGIVAVAVLERRS
ncbi:disulfide bond formation protein B [Halobiforma nitratireducens]|uniref:Disulfide bond formation protein n=1 Tax=Halobiforma nitratireducens JCM 10879 TaxID=1227454 RepID=M0LLP8_9EURY|nr:disulfide bond formation protein B [Halobiforma nitratireducens]EMA33389.1 disulfide bond formation protein [Halobiforma nitratireducens JCM 10879]